MKNDYWYQVKCLQCGNVFRVLQKDVDKFQYCPFCRIVPTSFSVSGTKKINMEVNNAD